MFKEIANRALLSLRVETITPLSIRAGDTGLDPGGSELKCVRTRRPGPKGDEARTVYIPGSSFKGVVRSAAESAIRGSSFHGVDGACDPLAHGTNCGARIRSGSSAEIHRGHCLACRLFGSLAMKGRASIRDLFPWTAGAGPGEERDLSTEANRTEVRHGVAIDRVSGGVSKGKLFELEVVPVGVSFWGEIAIENYQVWQLGLLADALAELNDGFAQLGSSKSRGLGVVRVSVERIVHEQAARGGERPLGVGRLLVKNIQPYGLLPEGELPEAGSSRRGLFMRFEIAGEHVKGWLSAGITALGTLK